MNGLRTAVVLGAGASYCYEDGSAHLPTQAEIVGRLFMGIRMSSRMRLGGFIGPSGLTYSEALSEALRKRFGIPYEPGEHSEVLDYWTILQERGYTLETLYSELDQDHNFPRSLLEDFEAVVRTAVQGPTAAREDGNVCRHHARLSSALEPGDYIVNFNWDTVMSDALLYRNVFWFPATGFGLRPGINPLTKIAAKRIPVDSLVHLFHVHGCVGLFEAVGSGGRAVIYIGPGTYSHMNSWFVPSGMDLSDRARDLNEQEPTRRLTDEEERNLALGQLCMGKPFLDSPRWFAPIFVPPSSDKAQKHDWYSRRLQ